MSVQPGKTEESSSDAIASLRQQVETLKKDVSIWKASSEKWAQRHAEVHAQVETLTQQRDEALITRGESSGFWGRMAARATMRHRKLEQQLASLAAAQERMTEALTVVEQWRWIKVLCGSCGHRYRYCRWCGVGSPDSVGSGEEQCGGHPATPCRSNCKLLALPSLAASSREVPQ